MATMASPSGQQSQSQQWQRCLRIISNNATLWQRCHCNKGNNCHRDDGKDACASLATTPSQQEQQLQSTGFHPVWIQYSTLLY
jgi:hypothetical protein